MTVKPLTIFISSTYSDLALYREAVHSCVASLENHAEDMVYWSADERAPADASVDKVRNSDLVILILAHRYGSIPVGGSKSIVELEYEAAKEKRIPILAFIVDPSTPWPPDQIDYDEDARVKLESFRRRVETDCVSHPFTSPESLAVAVTQAIANFDRRSNRGVLNWLRKVRDQESVSPRTDIRHRADLSVDIGKAEDGLPLVLRIVRSQDLRSHIERIGISLNRDATDPPLNKISNTLENEGMRVWRETGLHDVDLNGNRTLCYVSYNTLATSFSPSLVLRLLTAANNGHETPRGQYYERSFSESQNTIVGPISARRGYDSRVQSSGGANRFLALAVDSDDVCVVGWSEPSNRHSAIEFWRDFVDESILGFSQWTFELIESHSYDSSTVVATGDSTDYLEKVYSRLDLPKTFENTTYTTRIQTPLMSLIEMLLQTADRLSELHNGGYIHGDVKPQNMLLSKAGVVLIDSLNLVDGDIPPGLSPDWASPEQLLSQPVSKATDVYSLGLILSMILGAELTGELTQFSLPSKGRNTLRIPMLKNPSVYLEVEDRVLSLEMRKPWFDLIEKCLRYDPSERCRDAGVFRESLKAINTDFPIRGRVEFELSGTLGPELAILETGSEGPCRVVTDKWTSLQRPVVKHKW